MGVRNTIIGAVWVGFIALSVIVAGGGTTRENATAVAVAYLLGLATVFGLTAYFNRKGI